MDKNIKSIFFVLIIISLLVAVSAVNAADNTTDNSVSDMDTSTSTSSQLATQEVVQTSSDNNIENTENNIIKKESKNLKTTPVEHEIDDLSDWNNLVTSTGLASNVHGDDSLIFNDDITITGTNSYIIDKPINIDGQDCTLAHTGSGKTSIYFVSGASGSNITNLRFENIQVYVNTAEDIVFDNITFVVTQTGLGQGTGSFAIRDGSINITVKNSDFITTTNGGYSTLVLTWVKDCTIDNNTITGTGNIGNLVYLNNYGANTNANGITNNSHNTISNNTITATNNGIFCYSLVISGANNTIINNVVSNSYTYAITTIWAGSYDTETDPEDTHNVSYHGNKYINNTITGGFSTGNYSVIKDNSITGTSNIVGNANVTNNIFLGNVNLANDICFKDNDASTVTVNVNLPNDHFKNNQINTLNIPTVADPTYDCGGNTIGTTNGNFQSCNCGGTCCQTGNNNQLIKTTNNIKNEATPDNVDYYYGTWIDDNTWEVNITEENYNDILPDGIVTTNTKWFSGNLRDKNIILNIYYLPSDHDFVSHGLRANVTFHFMNNITLHNELFSIFDTSKKNVSYYSDGNLTITCDDEYLWREYDEYGYVTESHGLEFLDFWHTATIKNLEYNINLTEDYLEVRYWIYHEYYSVINGDNITFEDCTFNIQLPKDIKVYSSGFDSTNYTVQLLGTRPLEKPTMGNFTIINCTFNINSLAENEDEYPYFYSNLERENNQTFIFKGNTVNLNKVKGIQIATDGAIIEDNTINTNYDYAVELLGNNNSVQNNILIAKNNTGNDAVLVTGENNIVVNNSASEEQEQPKQRVRFTRDYSQPATMTLNPGEKWEHMGVTVYGSNWEPLTGKQVDIYVDGEYNSSTTVIDEGYPYARYTFTASTPGEHKVMFNMNDSEYEGNYTFNVTVASSKEYSLKVNTIEFTQGTNATITASILYGNELGQEIANNIVKGKVTFKVNGKTLKDENGKVIYAKVVNGTATIENYMIPDSWNEGSTIQAVYSGSTECGKLTSEKVNITINNEEPTFTTESVTAKAGDKITLKATITDNGKVINTGKVVFKINGKTVKDENGKVVYAKVVNNTVNVEYTIPDSFNVKDYNITAVFIAPGYDSLENTKTLTITE